MTAHHLCDARVDQLASPDYVKPRSAENVQEDPLLKKQLAGAELLDVLDKITSLEETFYTGASLPQSVYSCYYFQCAVAPLTKRPPRPHLEYVKQRAKQENTHQYDDILNQIEGSAKKSQNNRKDNKQDRSKGKGRNNQPQPSKAGSREHETNAGTTPEASSAESEQKVEVIEEKRPPVPCDVLRGFLRSILKRIDVTIETLTRAEVYESDEIYPTTVGLSVAESLTVEEVLADLNKLESEFLKRVRAVLHELPQGSGAELLKFLEQSHDPSKEHSQSQQQLNYTGRRTLETSRSDIQDTLAALAYDYLFVNNTTLAQELIMSVAILLRFRLRRQLIAMHSILNHSDGLGVEPSLSYILPALTTAKHLLDLRSTLAQWLGIAPESVPNWALFEHPDPAVEGAAAGSPAILAALESNPVFDTRFGASLLPPWVSVRVMKLLTPSAALQHVHVMLSQMYQVFYSLANPPAISAHHKKVLTTTTDPNAKVKSVYPEPVLHSSPVIDTKAEIKIKGPPHTIFHLVDVLRSLTFAKEEVNVLVRSHIALQLHSEQNVLGLGKLSLNTAAWIRSFVPGVSGWLDGSAGQEFEGFLRACTTAMATTLVSTCNTRILAAELMDNILSQWYTAQRYATLCDRKVDTELTRQGFDQSVVALAPQAPAGRVSAAPYRHPFFSAAFEAIAMVLNQSIFLMFDNTLLLPAEYWFVYYTLQYLNSMRVKNYDIAQRDLRQPGTLGSGPGANNDRPSKGGPKQIQSVLFATSPAPPKPREILLAMMYERLSTGIVHLLLGLRRGGAVAPELPQLQTTELTTAWYTNRFSQFLNVVHPSLPTISEMLAIYQDSATAPKQHFSKASQAFREVKAIADEYFVSYPASTPSTDGPQLQPILDLYAERVNALVRVASKNTNVIIPALKLRALLATEQPPKWEVAAKHIKFGFDECQHFPVIEIVDNPRLKK